MHRRPLGRGRRLAAFAALIIVVGCFLPWWQFGGDAGLPLRSGDAFEGAGILVFFAIGWIGFVLRAFDLFQVGALGLPTTSPGLWLSALGLGVLTRAAYEI